MLSTAADAETRSIRYCCSSLIVFRLVPIVTALTRGWLRVYTCRLPVPVADERRAEIESDIWEMEHDPDVAGARLGGAIALARLVDGIPDDLAWRLDNAAIEEQLLVRRVFALTAAAMLVLSVWPVPSMFVSGYREVAACASVAPAPKSRVAIPQEVIRCTGALFSSAR